MAGGVGLGIRHVGAGRAPGEGVEPVDAPSRRDSIVSRVIWTGER